MSAFRPNVAAILQKPTGEILVAERITFKDSWQFPQGGVDKGEDLIGALRREVREEIGVPPEKYTLEACRTGYRYRFPHGLLRERRFKGQEQTYFLCTFLGTDDDIRLDLHEQEFRTFRWIMPEEFRLEWVPEFKRKVFIRVMRDFFCVKLKTKKKEKE